MNPIYLLAENSDPKKISIALDLREIACIHVSKLYTSEHGPQWTTTPVLESEGKKTYDIELRGGGLIKVHDLHPAIINELICEWIKFNNPEEQ